MGYDAVVVGAGVVGCAIAFELGRRGARVALIDGGWPGGQASNAAAGILSPSAEADVATALWSLMQHSLAQYPDFVQTIEAEAQMAVEYQPTPVLMLAREPEDKSLLQARYRALREMAIAAEWYDDPACRRIEPWLGEGEWAGIRVQGEAQVHAPRLVQALVRALAARGVHTRFGEPAVRLLASHDRIAGVETTQGQYPAERVVVATGAWTHQWLAQAGIHVPVEPVRGQVLAFKPETADVRHIVFYGPRYLVPKPDGRLIVGATEDASGFDARVTARGLMDLADVMEHFPLPWASYGFERAWAGLRPKAPDGLPVIGPWPAHPELWVATGHYRNGILLTPVTAQLTADWAAGEPLAVDVTPFQPQRFGPVH